MTKRAKSRSGARAVGAKAPSQRQLRVGELIRHALSEVLSRGGVREPVLEKSVVTVTEVRMTPDLRRAIAFVSPLGGGDAAPVVAALTRVKAYLRGQLAHEVRLRHMPDLEFAPDTSFDYADHVGRLLESGPVKRDLAAEKGDV